MPKENFKIKSEFFKNYLIFKSFRILMNIDKTLKNRNELTKNICSYRYAMEILYKFEELELVIKSKGMHKRGVYYVLSKKGLKVKNMLSDIYSALNDN